MALSGSIKDFGLPDIFQLIGLQRKTGTLTLKRDAEQVTVVFENGMVVASDTIGKRIEDKLGHVLVKTGRLTRERLEEALAVQKQTLQRLGHVLVETGALAPKDLKAALAVQVQQTLFRLFRWKEGEYAFDSTDSVDYDRDNTNPMSADFILMEGIRMVDEWPIIEKKIPSMDLVFKSAVDPRLVELSGGSDDGGLDEMFAGMGGDAAKGAAGPAASKIKLTPDEHRVYQHVDGSNTVQQVVDSVGALEFEVCRTLFDLLNRNIIAPAGKGATRGAEAAAEAAAASPVLGYAALAAAILLTLAAVGMHRGAAFGLIGVPSALTPPLAALELDATRTRLARVDQAIRAFALGTGAAPTSLEELVTAGLVDGRHLRAIDGRAFVYAPAEGGYTLGIGENDPQPLRRTLAAR
ncbi:MAG: DUF4388 domain-containing protein [Vicinamibacteria bacterium]|nr:DUF4388 domain-containing protein [Vicinamibacteria bacterium]